MYNGHKRESLSDLPVCGSDGGCVAAEVPLANGPSLVPEPGQVLGHDPQVGGEGVGGGAHQDIILQTWLLSIRLSPVTSVLPVCIGCRPVIRALRLGVQMGLT